MLNGFRNWSDVRVFLAVLRAGSTLAAAKTLGMSQPTVARRIDALEHALKVRLFDRDTRGVRATQEALRLADKAAAIEAAALAFADEAASLRRVDTRPIRLTAPRVNFSENLAAAISDFQAQHPGVRFEFVASYKYLDLTAGEADVAIRLATRIEDDRLICRKLTDATGSLYAAKAYAARHGLPASEADLGAHTFVTLDRDMESFPIQRWLVERIRPEQIVSRCSDFEALFAAIRAGLAIGPLGTGLAVEDPSLLRCFPPPEGTSLPVWLVIGPDAYRRPEVKAFAAFFAPRFRQYIRKSL